MPNTKKAKKAAPEKLETKKISLEVLPEYKDRADALRASHKVSATALFESMLEAMSDDEIVQMIKVGLPKVKERRKQVRLARLEERNRVRHGVADKINTMSEAELKKLEKLIQKVSAEE